MPLPDGQEPIGEVEQGEGQLLAELGHVGCVGRQPLVELQRLAERLLRLRLAVGLVLQEGAQAQQRPGQLMTVQRGARVALDQFLVQFHGVTMLDLRLAQPAGLAQKGPEVGVGPHLDLHGAEPDHRPGQLDGLAVGGLRLVRAAGLAEQDAQPVVGRCQEGAVRGRVGDAVHHRPGQLRGVPQGAPGLLGAAGVDQQLAELAVAGGQVFADDVGGRGAVGLTTAVECPGRDRLQAPRWPAGRRARTRRCARASAGSPRRATRPRRPRRGRPDPGLARGRMPGNTPGPSAGTRAGRAAGRVAGPAILRRRSVYISLTARRASPRCFNASAWARADLGILDEHHDDAGGEPQDQQRDGHHDGRQVPSGPSRRAFHRAGPPGQDRPVIEEPAEVVGQVLRRGVSARPGPWPSP